MKYKNYVELINRVKAMADSDHVVSEDVFFNRLDGIDDCFSHDDELLNQFDDACNSLRECVFYAKCFIRKSRVGKLC